MKIAKKFVLLNLILINLFIRSSLTEEATHFTISTPKQTVLIYEPVSLTTEFDISGLAVKDLQFFLKINGKVVPDKTIIFPRYFSKTQVMKSKILKFMIELFYNTADRKYFFSTHGKYNITIHEWKTKRKSKPLILNVKNANRLEKEALQLFIGNEDKIVTFLTDKPKDTAMTDFRRLCEKYPNTVYALYASCTIAAHKFNEMLRDIKTRKKNKNSHSLVPKISRCNYRISP